MSFSLLLLLQKQDGLHAENNFHEVKFMKISQLIRSLVHDLHAYVPGEQPKIKGLIKLNTNENPFPPSPKVLAAVRKAADTRLRLYPNPTAQSLREKLAKLHGCKPENIIVGNGSDEALALAVKCFVEPEENPKLKTQNSKLSKTTVQYFTPSYSLYPVLADIHGATKNVVPLNPNFSLPSVVELKRGTQWNFNAALTLVTTPNAPSGRGYKTSELEKLCRVQKGVVVLDEAYVDFADENALELALKFPHVLVARTFSKAYSLCFQRVGYFVGNAELIAALDKIRDSYNVNGLGQIAAQATLDDLKYYRANFKKIIATREWLSRELTKLGFRVLPSQTNFILAKPPLFPAKEWLQKLRDKKILVRWFSAPEINQYLRITIGTQAEAAALVKAVRKIS
jgi:histidinol-phosphate aminotransferase